MLNISLNEYEDAKRYENEREVGKDFYNKLRVIAGKYFMDGSKESAVREKLKEHVNLCGESASLNVWSDMIDAAIKRAKKVPLVTIGSVSITKSELEKIDSLESTQLRRLAFTLLCLAKFRDGVNEENDHWICFEDKDIMRMANLRPSLMRQAELYRSLRDIGYLNFPKKQSSISMQILFSDNDSEEVLRISNFNNLGYQYLKYRGEPYFECECCGNTVKRKPGKTHHQKYCDQCAALIRAKQNTESVMRLRAASLKI